MQLSTLFSATLPFQIKIMQNLKLRPEFSSINIISMLINSPFEEVIGNLSFEQGKLGQEIPFEDFNGLSYKQIMLLLRQFEIPAISVGEWTSKYSLANANILVCLQIGADAVPQHILAHFDEEGNLQKIFDPTNTLSKQAWFKYFNTGESEVEIKLLGNIFIQMLIPIWDAEEIARVIAEIEADQKLTSKILTGDQLH